VVRAPATCNEVNPIVKQILVRFTYVVMVLAALSMTLGAGIRWGCGFAASVIGGDPSLLP
jgi:hypothetical protein